MSIKTDKPSQANNRVIKINPPELFNPVPYGFTQISIDRKNCVAHIAGQTAFDENDKMAMSTFPEQLQKVADNLHIALKTVGASVDDILKANAFIVDFLPSRDLPVLTSMMAERLGSPVVSYVGTTCLAADGLLVEIEMDVAVGEAFLAERFPLREVE